MQTRENPTGPGALRRRASRGRARATGGLRVGDIIVGVGGKPVIVPDDISLAIDDRKPGDRVEIEVERAGARKTLR